MATEKTDLEELLKLLGESPHLYARTSVGPRAFAVYPGSELSNDDRRTDPHQISHAAWHALTIASDHLHCMRSAIAGCLDHQPPGSVRLHIYAPFTLLRATLENASTAVWLLAPEKPKERALRRLRLAAANARQSDAIGQLTGSPLNQSLDERLENLRRIAKRCSVNQTEAVRAPKHSDIVHAAGAAAFQDGDMAATIWRTCSGLTHGNIWATLSMLDRRIHADPVVPTVVNAEVTTSIAGLRAVLGHSIAMLRFGFELFDRRARSSNRGGRQD